MAEAEKQDPLDWTSPIADIPVVGDFIDAIVTFFRVAAFMIGHLDTWADELDLAERPRFIQALKFFAGSLTISYFITIPVLFRWDVDQEQIIYILHNLTSLVLTLALLHLGLKIVGSRAGFRQTMSGFLLISGLQLPIYMLLMLPTAWVAGPSVLGVGAPRPDLHHERTLLITCTQTVLGGVGAAVWGPGLKTLQPLFGLSFARIFAGIALGGVAAALFDLFLKNPLFAVIDPGLRSVTRFL